MLSFDKNMLNGKNKIHFIGIGGSGMYPIVQILHGQGYEISGSDINTGTNIDMEIAMGIEVFIGHHPDNIKGADLIVYSAAVSEDNPELIAAKEHGIPTLERSKMLGFVTGRFNNCICISGTHGKTTTTSMTTHILMKCGKDPSAVIGGRLPIIDGNGRHGLGESMVCEACEFKDTFLHLKPDISVILNIDEDHMDYFKTMDNLLASFKKFANLATKYILMNGDDDYCKQIAEQAEKKVITFGFTEKSNYYAKDVKLNGLKSSFILCHEGKELCKIELSVPGIHNVSNALCASVAAILSDVQPKEIPEAIADFRGAGRRFELLGEVSGVTIVDDFAHHPAEIDMTLKAAKSLGYKKVWAVFQPYTYSRTALLLDDFIVSLSTADELVMTEIVSAREENIYNVHTKNIADKIPNSRYFSSFEEICDYVMQNAKAGDLVITMGGGDIYKCAKLMMNYKSSNTNIK